jgi:hypothetical protein
LLESLRVLKDNGQIIIADPEENPTDSVQALFGSIDLSLNYFKHSTLVNHSRWVIDSIARDYSLTIENNIGYSIDWEFNDFEDMQNCMIADYQEIDWDERCQQIAKNALQKIVKNIDTSKSFVIHDRMEVAIISKRKVWD